MTTGLPRVKLSRFSIATLTLVSRTKFTFQLIIAVTLPTSRLHRQSPVQVVWLIVSYSNYNARSGLPTILVTPNHSTRLSK